jgi:hypothetical protein
MSLLAMCAFGIQLLIDLSLSLNKRDLRQFQNCQASVELYKGFIATQTTPLEKRIYEGAFYS